MKFFAIIFFPIIINGHFLPAEKAKALLSRQKRGSGFFGWLEKTFTKTFTSSIDRDCVEESCDFEEYIEAKENEFSGKAIDLREQIKLKPMIETHFNRFYVNCETDEITERQACFK